MSDTKTKITPMSAVEIKQLRDLATYRNEISGPGLAYFSPERALALVAAYDAAEARAEKAEAKNARLTKEQNWLLDRPVFLGICPSGVDKRICLSQCKPCWAEASRRAVATPPTTETVSTPCPICGAHGHIGDCEGD